ncbi:SEC14-like protein 2 isoform X1 [Daphnia pulicaria]|uniref:SEC14-like protein 2 isoform X1 n=1 Tax=Daphnia pulicaria TaxID=35523 RepID=UPI001EE9E8C0|nr:SEC14-like protein 2 isoform X1 [Daphnia pulicaria]
MSGSKLELNEEQQVALDQFRNEVKDCQLKDSSDEYLLKWLKAQVFDVGRAEKMLRQSLEWRRESGADEILQTYVQKEVFTNYFSVGLVGIDKFDGPVFVCVIGRVDIKGLLLSVTHKEFSNFTTWMCETFALAINQEIERTGKRTTQLTLMLDFEHFSMRQMASKQVVEALLEMIRTYLINYPNSFRRIFVVNAPKVFHLLFALVKPILSPADIPKIKIFGNDKNEWASALLEEIDAEYVPSYYGGTLTDPDGNPKCPSKLNMGGEVPASYYLSNNGPVAKDYMETMTIIAGAGGRKKMKYKVDVASSILKWEFMTEGGDIRFRVYTKNAKGSEEDLVLPCRVDSHLAMEEGQMACDEPGKYVFEFDNTFSYLRTKKVRYRIFVEPPSSEKV